jgi:hypothetical protein
MTVCSDDYASTRLQPRLVSCIALFDCLIHKASGLGRAVLSGVHGGDCRATVGPEPALACTTCDRVLDLGRLCGSTLSPPHMDERVAWWARGEFGPVSSDTAHRSRHPPLAT